MFIQLILITFFAICSNVCPPPCCLLAANPNGHVSLLCCPFSCAVFVQSCRAISRAFTDERLPAQLGVCIGLAAVNVTYAIAPESNYSTSIDVHFNERFHFTRPTSIQEEYKESLVKGTLFWGGGPIVLVQRGAGGGRLTGKVSDPVS